MNPIFSAPVVCNAGPLIGLARVDLAWLPFRLFPEVFVPEEVCAELLVGESPGHIQLGVVLDGILKSAKLKAPAASPAAAPPGCSAHS